MFIGREQELQDLNDEWETGFFGMPVIYGRRRVGKTSILEQFSKNKDTLFFTPVIDAEGNVRDLCRLAVDFGIQTNGGSIQQILEDIFKAAKERRFAFIIDEYPYLELSNPGTSSVLQKLIDKNYENSKLFLVLCGSSMNFMKNQVLGYESPIFGRRTAQFLIEPFSLYESLDLLPHSSFIQACELYGLTDGTPAYLAKLNSEVGLKENLLSAFLKPTHYLFEEAEGLLKQELKYPKQYNSFLNIVGSRTLRIHEIADKMGKIVERNQCVEMAMKLEDIGILERVVSWNEPGKEMWRIKDCYFRFWHTFMPNVKQAVQNRQALPAADYIIKYYSEYMGGIFEKICMQWLEKESRAENLPINAINFGKWWGTDKIKKEQAEIDIVASDINGNMIFGECKWHNDQMQASEIEKLIHRSTLVKKKNNCKQIFYFFSKSGFSPAAINKAKEREDCELIDLDTLTPAKEETPQALSFRM